MTNFIKEIDFQSKNKNKYLYKSIILDTIMEQPFKFNISILHEVFYKDINFRRVDNSNDLLMMTISSKLLINFQNNRF